MCGLFGCWILPDAALSDGRRMILTTSLASLNDQRGGHSWGYLRYDEDEEEKVVVHHGLGDIADAVDQFADAYVFFGHTRYATHGERTIANAHPFEIGNVIGAHNGVLANHAELNKTYGRNFAVDSMHLIAHLNEGREFDDIEGYGALEWTRKDEPGRIYLVRMRGGNLAIRGLGRPDPKDPKKTQVYGVVWSSDSNHLLSALSRAGIRDDFPFHIDTGQVYSVEDGKLYELSKKLDLKQPITVERDWKNYSECGVGGYADGLPEYYGRGRGRHKGRNHTKDDDDRWDSRGTTPSASGNPPAASTTSALACVDGEDEPEITVVTDGAAPASAAAATAAAAAGTATAATSPETPDDAEWAVWNDRMRAAGLIG